MLAVIRKMHWRNTRSMSESRSSARDVGLWSPYLVPIFEGVTTVVQRPAYVARPRSVCKAPTSRLAQKNKMQAQLLHNLLHGATLPTSRLWSAEGFTLR
jgi:hypothetical protein